MPYGRFGDFRDDSKFLVDRLVNLGSYVVAGASELGGQGWHVPTYFYN